MYKAFLTLFGMDFGDRITQIRKEKSISREELGHKIGTSGAIVGRYERNEMKPSIEIATKIAKALSVSLDFLVGNSPMIIKDNKILERLENIANMPHEEKTQLFNVIDAYIRDYKTRQAYSA